MKKNIVTLALLTIVSINAMAWVQLPSDNTCKQSLNGVWDFKFDNSDWTTIKVPACWEMEGFCKPVYGEKLRNMKGIYRKTLHIPSAWKTDDVFVCFEGVQYAYSVFVNGDSIGYFSSAFNRQIFNITKAIKPGKDNELVVHVITNPRGWQFDTNDDWTLSGIYRDVTLFHLPKTHIDDICITTRMDGTVNVSIKASGKKAKARLALLDKSGNIVAEGQGLSTQLKVSNPKLWTAETPYLYTLKVELFEGKKIKQNYQTKVGIRELQWTDGTLKLNGKPVMFKGVNHHDLSEVNGRGLSEAELQRDIRMMKDGNINLIRCSHYPPQPRLLEICDSVGIYVLDEVPFGFGDKLLSDTTYQSILLDRTLYTYLRDKNHPSVVYWNIGNENPFTPICEVAGLKMGQLDPTRPFGYAQTPTVCKNTLEKNPSSVVFWDWHYIKPEELPEYADKLHGKPLIAGEHTHALGLDFGGLEDEVEAMYRTPCCNGGAIWMFQDQGILKKSEKAITQNENTIYTWLNATEYYDTKDDQGTDGIVYSNRVPQTDYFETRKVYAPVKITMLEQSAEAVKINIENRYDFTNLSSLTIDWALMANQKAVSAGTLSPSCAPRQSVEQTVAVKHVPEAYTWLQLTVKDKDGKSIYEKSFPLSKPQQMQVANVPTPQPEYLKTTYFRVGRKPTMASVATTQRRRSAKLHTLWSPFIQTQGDFDKKVDYKTNADGSVDVTFEVTLTKEMETVETGLSFVIPEQLTEMRFVGKGPYPSYSNKRNLSEYGVYHLNSSDLYFGGNRQDVDLCLFTDANGEGFAIIADKANIAVERSPEGLIVSYNTFSAGLFKKGEWPTDIKKYAAGEKIRGTFKIVPLKGKWAETLTQIFGPQTHTATPFAPFYNSYDQ